MRFTLAFTAAILISGAAYASEESPLFAVIVSSNNRLDEMSPATARRIFDGTITDWSAVPESGMTGPILALRLVDSDPATVAFKQQTGLTQFGTNINLVRGGMAKMIIAVAVANNGRAIGVDDPTALVAGDARVEIDD